jgi:glycosyltransferase involved in cell wall biosynthesis
VFPVKVTEHITVTTFFLVGPSQIFKMVNYIFTKLFVGLIKRYYCKEKFVLLINDFEPDNRPIYEELFPMAHLVVIDLSDDFLAFGEKEPRNKLIRNMLRECVERADIVLCVNETIRDKYRNSEDKYYVLANGISVDRFMAAIPSKNPFNKLGILHPIIGYMGWMSSGRIDKDLIVSLINRFNKCSIVLLGQDVNNFAKKLSLVHPNVYFIPAVPFDEMLNFVRHFDVAIIPHKKNEHTAGNNLLKIPIFMASKVPVVATNVSDVSEYADVIDIASDSEDFCNRVKNALLERNTDRLNRGYEMALSNSFEKSVKQLYDDAIHPLLARRTDESH